MEKAKRYAFLLLALLCVAVPLIFFCLPASAPPQDLAHYDYFAVSAPGREEVVYQTGEADFSAAAQAFVQATAVSQLPSYLADSIFLTTDWVRDGRVQSFRLYLSPARQEGYLVNDRSACFRLAEDGLLFFLQKDFVAPLLVGEMPPPLRLGETEIPFSLCQWTYTLTTRAGAAVTVSSGEYTNTEGGSIPVSVNAFVPTFGKTPNSVIYTIYSGADVIFSSNELPALDALSQGEYQLILVAEWQTGNTRIRAGYSMFLAV